MLAALRDAGNAAGQGPQASVKSDPMKPLAPNTMILERYLVVHLIGKGGMGEVYLAVDQRLGSAVAKADQLCR